jgi:nucleoside-diphosphate-sugar epimerase
VNEIAAMVGGPVEFLDARPGEMRNTLADTSLAKSSLGWEPKVRFADGVAELLSK